MNLKELLLAPRTKILFKVLFVGTLLYLMLSKGDLDLQKTRAAYTRLEYIIPGFLAMLGSSLLCFIRWQILLRALGINLPWSRTIQLGFIGAFFNIALPGAVTGDVVKALYVAKEAPGKRAWALSSILFDRVAGLSALILVSACALISSLFSGMGGGIFDALSVFVGLAGFCVILFFGYLFVVTEQRDPLLRLFRSIEKRFERLSSLTRIYEGLRHYHSHRKAVAMSMGLSIMVHILVVSACTNFSRAMGEQQIALLSIFAVVPLGLVVAAIPIAPAGVGTGHYAFQQLFAKFLGSARGGDVFTLYVSFIMLTGLMGGVVYLRFKARAPDPEEQRSLA